MLANLKARRDSEEGFTLIELMVVVLIIAILIAIAIPTFLGARERAQERAAQSSVRNALTAAKTLFTDDESYTQASTLANMTAVEPSLTYKAAAADSTGQNDISIEVEDVVALDDDDAVLVLAAEANSGDCFFLMDIQISGGAGTPGTYYTSTSGPDCSASDAPAQGAAAWDNTGW